MKNLSATKLMTLAACASTSVVSANGRTYTSSSSKLDFVKASHSSVTEISRGGASDKNHNEKSHNKPSSSSSASKKKTNKTKKKKKRQRQTDDEKGEDDTPPPPPNAVVEEVLERSDFYEILGIGRSATQVEIKKAYRKRALHVHPDKTGGDRRAFDKVAESYDVLGDDNKRQLYNQFGKDGLENSSGGASAGSYQDVFRSMFQQQTRGYGRSRQNFTMRYQIEVTLEDLYKGITQQVVVTPPHHTPSSHRKQKRVSVDVPKGAYPGQHITLSGEMDFSQNDTPGDLVFVVQQAPHPAFTRKGHDLAMQLTITLEEAICGLKRDIRHLDGTKIWIESALVEDNKDQNTPILIQTGDVSRKELIIQ
jgi:curved DNA-binding protein CbpA